MVQYVRYEFNLDAGTAGLMKLIKEAMALWLCDVIVNVDTLTLTLQAM